VKLYRVMKVDADGRPRVGRKGYMLGVRPTDPNNTDPRRRFDVAAVNDADLVSPGEGLSTALDPTVLVVRSGEARFMIDTDDLGAFGLQENPDYPPHCLIEPVPPMPLRDFQQALADTCDSWEQVR
jgi:hypothetical protein